MIFDIKNRSRRIVFIDGSARTINIRSCFRCLGVIFLGSLVVASCGNNAESEKSLEVLGMSGRSATIELPTGNKIYVRRQGEFRIGPQTMFCRAPRNIDPALRDVAPGFFDPGLASIENASLGEQVKGARCDDDGVNLVNSWTLSMNRDGSPYKMILVVWQGKLTENGAIWIGGVERPAGEIPDFRVSSDGPTLDRARNVDAEKRYYSQLYLKEDARRLSELFSRTLSGESQ